MNTLELDRQTGRTTRLVDEYIQKLFDQGEIIVKDHCNNRQADDFLFDRILRRLQSEHSNYRDICLECNKNKHLIRIDLSKLYKNRTVTCKFTINMPASEVVEFIKTHNDNNSDLIETFEI